MKGTESLFVAPELAAQYRRDGYFILHEVIPASELEMIREECAQLVRQQEVEMDRQKTDVLNLSRRNSRYFVFLAYKDRPQLGSFIFSDRMAAICRATIGDTAGLCHSVLPGTGSRSRWITEGSRRAVS